MNHAFPARQDSARHGTLDTPLTKERIEDSIRIPTIPQIVARIDALIEDPETGLAEIGAVVAEDPPLSAKVLKISNTTHYGLSEPVLSAEQAAVVLGTRVLRTIALQAAVIGNYEHLESSTVIDVPNLWKHSILTAQIAQDLTVASHLELPLVPEELYTCGLLHDLGRIILLDTMAEDYVSVLRHAQETDQPSHALEAERLGFSHTDVGSLVASTWGLPDPTVAAIDYHHGPNERIVASPVTMIVALADRLTHYISQGRTPSAEAVLQNPVGRRLGLSRKRVEAIVEGAPRSWDSIEM